MLRSVLPLGFIAASRFFGLFIILPVLSLYALELDGANEFLAGLTIGAYAITQMIFQLPFGSLSDRFGRKFMIFVGLIIFIIGSLICAISTDIYTMLFGRLLQGCGAVGAVATAMISDLVSEDKRSKAMAMMGGMIGIAFAISMILSPLLSREFGLSSLFYLSIIVTIFCIFLLFSAVPKEPKIHHHDPKIPLTKLLKQKDLAIMNLTNLMQKMLMSCAFVAIPIVLVKSLEYSGDNLWIVYLISMIFGFLAMGMAGFLGDGKGHSKKLLLIGVVLFIISFIGFGVANSAVSFIIFVVIFFIGFNIHEPILQSCASKFAKSNQRGSALGIFNSFGYLGSFLGGAVGGYLLHSYNITALAVVLAVVLAIWLLILFQLSDPRIFQIIRLKNADISILDSVNGIVDRYKQNGYSIVKFNSNIISRDEVISILGVSNEELQ
ncbi:MFS transporter [Campylobacter lanienae]|uniref:MFS transporter n=1 Tax=Campylobacter lanienae TaxID=75658 RepID=UPI00242B7AEF|nr:MFS transporter [Campylobacter lanienae]MDD7513849.1 MFS transporter [Campylobacter lanienae]MDY5520037.1 MFS transporter [Campylobacter lanienae]MDY6134373.1 MFS transporter [Campylobacter lanienae]